METGDNPGEVHQDQNEGTYPSNSSIPHFNTLIPFREKSLKRHIVNSYEKTFQHSLKLENVESGSLIGFWETPETFTTSESLLKSIKVISHPPVVGCIFCSGDDQPQLNSQNEENLLLTHFKSTGTEVKQEFPKYRKDNTDAKLILSKKAESQSGNSKLKSTEKIEDTFFDDLMDGLESKTINLKVNVHPEPLLNIKLIQYANESQQLMSIIQYFKLEHILNNQPWKPSITINNEFCRPSPKRKKEFLKQKMIKEYQKRLEVFVRTTRNSVHEIASDPSQIKLAHGHLDSVENAGSESTNSDGRISDFDAGTDDNSQTTAHSKKLKRIDLNGDTPAIDSLNDIPSNIGKGTIKKYKCEWCQKEFPQRGHFNRHIEQIHKGIKKQKCHICDKFMGQNLKRHLKTHDEKTHFLCSICGEMFRRKEHMQKHELVHNEVKPFPCNFCEKAFRQKCNLEVHTRKHTMEKPYNCENCEMEFTTSSDLYRHGKLHSKRMF